MNKEIDNPYLPDIKSGMHGDVIKKIKKIFESQPDRRIILVQGNSGTGKTSTLKQLADSSHMIGEKYVFLYLDSREYIGLNADDLSFSLYKHIIENLNKRGYEIPQPDYFKERRQRGDTLQLLLLTVAAHLKSSEILVLILDELDRLLEKADVKTISSLIQYFQNIERSWSNYGLILSGDRRLTNLTNNRVINDFLKMAYKLDIEEDLNKESLKKLITRPVENQLTYDDDAVERIIWYSAGNLYFQQLICHHLVNYMNEIKKNQCSIQDVEAVVQRMLDTTISEFVFGWENKLSIEGRLIASALADESVTEKKGNLYCLKENSLLDHIFGRNLSKEMEKLQDFGYIDEMRKRYFSRDPIKIPLYGKWIRQEHPFIKTIIENIDAIADKIDLKILINEIEKTPESKLLPFEKEAILNIAEKWNALANTIVQNRTNAEPERIELFFKRFCHRLNLIIKETGHPFEGYFIIDIRNLKIGILEQALCFIQDRPELTSQEISLIERRAAEFAQEAQTKLTLFFYFQESGMVEDLVKKAYLSLVPIDENDLKRIILPDRPTEIFRKIILSKLSLKRVSPYKSAGPTTTTFYGRSGIINQITGSINTSFAIVGARKIGKTSLLYKIKENPPPNIPYIFMDLDYEFSNVKNYQTFLKSLQFEIQGKFNKKVDLGKFPFGPRLSKLPNVIKELSQNGQKKIIFIFDEIDGLIEFDKKHSYKLIRIFRSLSQENYCQFIFSGFKYLYSRKREINNPLYNFCEEIILGPLERGAALDLITKPMETIGIHYKNPEDRELILGYTASHPNLLQFFCKHLIEKIERHENVEERRTIFMQDIEKLYDTTYEEYIMNEVYMFSSLTNLDQLILVLLVEEMPQRKIFSEDEIRHYLKNHDIAISRKEVLQHLENLVMRFILLDQGKDNYKFALSVFPEILKKRIDDYLKHKIIMEIKENVSQSL